MAYTTVYKDIIFVEGECSEAVPKRKIKADLSGIGSQLKTLHNVKDSLVRHAKLAKCNCIQDFKYGQKSSWFAVDNVKFFGSGTASVLSDADYEKIIKTVKQ